MTIRFATDDEVAMWDELCLANPDGGNVLQSQEFLTIKASSGWKPRYIMADTRAVSILEKTFWPLGKIWYCPKGPSTTSLSDLNELMEHFQTFARRQGVFSIKIEPELTYDTNINTLGMTKTRPVQQHFSTVWVDISPSEEDILASLPQKGRHAIRRAERDGVTVKAVDATDKNYQIMYGLLHGTSVDAKFVIRPADYYRLFYETYGVSGRGQLFFAYYEGQVVAAAYAMVFGTKSIYKDGASIRKRTAYGASHLLQWHVIQWAKSKGSLSHDLCGVPPIDRIDDPTHPFYGLGRFKTSFSKQVTQYVGAYEVPIVPWKSRLWQRYLEKIIRRLYFNLHRQSYY